MGGVPSNMSLALLLAPLVAVDPAAQDAPDGCVARLDATSLSFANLRAQFRSAWAAERPIIIANLADHAAVRKAWTADYLLKEASRSPVTAQPSQLIAQFGGHPRFGSPLLRDYMQHQRNGSRVPLAFDRGNFFETEAGARLASQLDPGPADSLLGASGPHPSPHLVFSLGDEGAGRQGPIGSTLALRWILWHST